MFDKRKNLDYIAVDTVGEYYRVDTVGDIVDCMYFGGDLGKNFAGDFG